MDILTSAKHLQKLLILHDKADRHVHCLGKYICQLMKLILTILSEKYTDKGLKMVILVILLI